MVLNAVAEACGVAERLPLETQPDEPLLTVRTEAPPAWQELLAGTVAGVRHGGERIEILTSRSERHGVRSLQLESPASRRAIFPGSYNPMHAGHLQMAALAETILGQPVEFEISIENVDKPPLNFTAMSERLAQFQSPPRTLWFTRARSTLSCITALFPKCDLHHVG